MATSLDRECPICGEELTFRYTEWSEDVCGLYCEGCDKSYSYDTGQWGDGLIGAESPWYGTDELPDDLWGDEEDRVSLEA